MNKDLNTAMLYGWIVYQTQNTIVEENDCHFLAKVVVLRVLHVLILPLQIFQWTGEKLNSSEDNCQTNTFGKNVFCF